MDGASLRKYNSFGLSVKATKVVITECLDQMIEAYQESQKFGMPFLVLGDGSNVLFTEDFTGTILINRLKGVEMREDNDAWYLHVCAGENWHKLIEWTLDNNVAGLENMALIPGCVGAAPNQNIGAYGVELRNVCDYVDVINLSDGIVKRLSNEQCEFGHRDSIFKRSYTNGYAIIAVGFRLKKQWRPVLSYGDLVKLDPETVTPRQIFEIICTIRRSKLPDPKVIGNAGSFFKSVVVCKTTANELLKMYPNMPQYPNSNDKVRIASGWLIEYCQLKGFRIGDAAVHEKHALVLVNLGNAESDDIVSLARYVRKIVADTFGLWLEAEVRFIGAHGYVDSNNLLQ